MTVGYGAKVEWQREQPAGQAPPPEPPLQVRVSVALAAPLRINCTDLSPFSLLQLERLANMFVRKCIEIIPEKYASEAFRVFHQLVYVDRNPNVVDPIDRLNALLAERYVFR